MAGVNTIGEAITPMSPSDGGGGDGDGRWLFTLDTGQSPAGVGVRMTAVPVSTIEFYPYPGVNTPG